MAVPFVRANNLSKTYGIPQQPLEVLRGVNLEVHPGEFIAIIGPSGIGKTTLLNMITAIDKPNGGEVLIGETNVTRTPENQLVKWRARNIGIVFQFFQLLPTISVVDNVMLMVSRASMRRASGAMWRSACWTGWEFSIRRIKRPTCCRAGSSSGPPLLARWPITRR